MALWAVRRRHPILAYAPIWRGIDLVRDEVTGVRKRLVRLTAFLICGGVALVRPDAYEAVTVKTTVAGAS